MSRIMEEVNALFLEAEVRSFVEKMLRNGKLSKAEIAECLNVSEDVVEEIEAELLQMA